MASGSLCLLPNAHKCTDITCETHPAVALMDSSVFSPADDMEAIPVKHFVKHIMELYKNNLQGFSEEFEVRCHNTSTVVCFWFVNFNKREFYSRVLLSSFVPSIWNTKWDYLTEMTYWNAFLKVHNHKMDLFIV